LTLLLVVIWPVPLYISSYIFSLPVFYIWLATALAWTIGAAIIIIVLPLIESRDDIMRILKNLLIPLILGIIISITLIASALFYSSLVREAPEVAEYTLTFIYSILGTIGGFAIIVILLNRKLSKLVEHRTIELEKINEELRLKDKLKDEFISIASHELRAPIQPLLGFVMLAKKKRIDNDKAWEGVLKHAQKLQHLANEILDVSRIESGNLTLSMERVTINNLIIDVVNAMKPRLNKNVQLVTMLDRDIDIKADKFRIGQVLANLLDNAIKFTDRGRITVQTRIVNDKVEIMISDTGKGIPEDIMPNLFGKFVTKSADGNSQYGAGLGLFISKAIIKAHDGDIIATNTDTGASFRIILPINDHS
jgi:signal transduction histidine kinase